MRMKRKGEVGALIESEETLHDFDIRTLTQLEPGTFSPQQGSITSKNLIV